MILRAPALRTAFLVALTLPLTTTACRRDPGTAAVPTPPPPPPPREEARVAPLPDPTGLDPAKVELGRRLYHDPRLSGDGTLSCASCHDLARGGADAAVSSTGIRGQIGPINSPTTLNSSLHFAQFWDGRAATLEEQAAGPVANPLEMGAEWPTVVATLQQDDWYAPRFAAAYPAGLTQETVTHAIAEYERTLITPGRWDAYLRGDDSALTEQELRGFTAFQQSGCLSCHYGPALGGQSYEKFGVTGDYFADRGTPLTDADLGRFNVTGNESDRHKFKVPTLRNVAQTAPYFHDGSTTSLAEAVRIMARYQLGRELSDATTADIVAFLQALDGPVPDSARLPEDQVVAPATL
jgi:cytochrome c peroxidase